MTRINWDRASLHYVRPERPLRSTIRAKFGSNCVVCGERFDEGDPIASTFIDGRRRYGHGDCIYGATEAVKGGLQGPQGRASDGASRLRPH